MHRQQNVLLCCLFFPFIKYLPHTHGVPGIKLSVRDQVVHNIPSEGQMHGEFERLTKLCDILQKWVIEIGNWSANMKLQQINEK